MILKTTEAAAYYPVTRAEAKAWCRLDTTDEDAIVDQLLGAMVDYAENLTGRAFVQREYRLTLPRWPAINTQGYYGPGIKLPRPPLVGVLSVDYIDEDGADQELAVNQYVVHSDPEPALIVPAWQVTWPTLRAVLNAVQVTYQAGYAPVGSPSDEAAHQAGQPEALKVWLQARISTLFDNRGHLMNSSQVEIPRAFADGILDSLVLGERIA